MDVVAVVLETATMTAIENRVARVDGNGNLVRDEIIFECSARYPRPELFSVVPNGDLLMPNRPPMK